MTTMETKVKIEVKMYIIANNFFMSKFREKMYTIEKMRRKNLHLIFSIQFAVSQLIFELW